VYPSSIDSAGIPINEQLDGDFELPGISALPPRVFSLGCFGAPSRFLYEEVGVTGRLATCAFVSAVSLLNKPISLQPWDGD
jgi:hypothetical protein